MSYVDEILDRVKKQNPDQPEFNQAVYEVLESLRVVIEKNEEKYRKDALLEKCLCCKGQTHVVYDELITSGEEFTEVPYQLTTDDGYAVCESFDTVETERGTYSVFYSEGVKTVAVKGGK